ncbi:MAG TPA: F0F1 ATP synthase subunit A [Polyangiaceae bacterium]|jgi:F-type H+-transporting ATPase subunit a|nr:F0F1 ATP synthase subunit A [Polyangiaceae bacterium]
MPEHTSWFTLLLAHMHETLDQNAQAFGETVIQHEAPSWRSFEPMAAALFVTLLVLGIALRVRARLQNPDDAIVPEDRLTLRTFMEAFLGYFYDLAKSVMDAERAKKYFPLIGTAAMFVFFSNVLALIPGFPVATSSLSITLGCAIVVFVCFNAYGLATNGFSYIAHLAGPAWYLAWLVFPIEVISLTVRPITLAVRLMLNMSVDHLILGIFLSLVAALIPIPVMILGCLIILIQTLVFTLLTCIYIGLATEHEAH